MFAEEQFLREKFDKIYLDWASNVPAFVPNFKNWTPPDRKFNFRKVLRKEKDGFLSVVVLVFLFNYIEEYGKYNSIIQIDIWFILLIFAVVLYAVIQFLKKKTRILHD